MPYEQVQKVTEDGKLLFLLPQPDLEVSYTITRRIMTTEDTGVPVMVTLKTPMKDGNGNQMRYEVTRTVDITETQTDEEGNEIVVVVGQEQVGTGQFLDLFTTEEVQDEEEDTGLPWFWETVEDPAVRYEPQQPIEITEDDERYVEGLEPAYELIELPPEPVQERVSSPVEQQLANLQESHKTLKQQVDVSTEKVNTTSVDLGGFMDFYFENL